MTVRPDFLHRSHLHQQAGSVLPRQEAHERSVVFLLALVTATVWGAVLWGSFQYDDYANVVTDPATTQWPVFLQRLFSGIRPLTRASYFLDQCVWGMSASGFLCTNLLLHVCTTVGVFYLARCRILPLYAAITAALVFALQPAHAETVAYVSGRSTGLMTCLLVWGLVVHDRAGKNISWLAAFLFVAACLAKEVALIFPLLVLLWESTPSKKETQAKPNFKGVFLYMVIAVVGLAVLATSPRLRDLLAYSLALRSPAENLLLQLRAIPETLALWFRPDALTVDHNFTLAAGPIETLAGALVLLGMIVFALASYRRAPLITLAIAWVLLALVPTHSIIARLDVVTEKPLYLAWVGPAILIGALWQRAVSAAQKPLQGFAITAGLAVMLLIAALMHK